MKLQNIILGAATALSVLAFASCNGNKDGNKDPDFSGTYNLADQMGRPAINTVFGSEGMKDNFNRTILSGMGIFQPSFQAKLLADNPDYTTNLLGLDAATFTTVLASDALDVSLDGVTTFYDGTPAHTLTGRQLKDDVIDVELILIFGGPTGADKPGLTSDHVDANDKAFTASFPYLAAPF